MIPKLTPILNAKWVADEIQPDFIHGFRADGESYLICAPADIRDLLVTMQNNLVMQTEYVNALESELGNAQGLLRILTGTFNE